MRRFALFLACLGVSGHGIAVASDNQANCDVHQARAFVQSLMAAAISPDCVAKLEALSAPPALVRACKETISNPDAAMKKEFVSRSSYRYAELHQANGQWTALGHLSQPDPVRFDEERRRRAFCGWSLHSPENQDCSPIDWSKIPMVEEEVSLPLTCAAGRWQVPGVDGGRQAPSA